MNNNCQKYDFIVLFHFCLKDLDINVPSNLH